MKTLAEMAATGVRGEALAAAIYEDTFGSAPPRPYDERTPDELRASIEEFFSIMRSMTAEELAEDPFQGRPLNVSILSDDAAPKANAA